MNFWPTPEHVKQSNDADWPRWVKPHDSHVMRKTFDGEAPAPSVQPSNIIWDPGNVRLGTAPDHVVVPGFEHHVDRATGEITVLVHNEAEERKALEPSETVKAAERERLAQEEQAERDRIAAEEAEAARLEREATEERERLEREKSEEVVGEEQHHD